MDDILGQLLIVVVPALVFVWYGFGAYGLYILYKKGYLSFMTGAGCILWILIGWWAVPIFLALTLGFGAFTLLIAKQVKPRQRCPHCRRWIAGNADRCPECTSEVVPLYT